ncbi:WD40 repeat domain-containing protein, partial [Aspergillus vadensis CBS 113365]
LVSDSADKTIRLWNTATGALKHILKGHSEWISSVAFSGDGQMLISGSRDKTIRLWDTATGALKHNIRTDKVSLGAGRWITIQGQRELWLPPNYHPHSLTVKSSTIGTGTTTGRVAIITFSVM